MIGLLSSGNWKNFRAYVCFRACVRNNSASLLYGDIGAISATGATGAAFPKVFRLYLFSASGSPSDQSDFSFALYQIFDESVILPPGPRLTENTGF
jgi:hypothetical protein